MIITRWAQLGFERSFLAYPTTDELATYDNARRVSYFQKGSIHWSPSGPGLGAVPSTYPTFGTVRGLFDDESRRHMRLGSPEGTPAQLMNLETTTTCAAMPMTSSIGSKEASTTWL